MRKSYRIKKENEFQDVYKKGEVSANKNFVLYQMEKPDQKHYRIGISVGKKVSNLAVDRNRVKRYIRQSIFEINEEYHLPNELDFLIIARKNSKNLDMSETKKNLIHLLKLGKLIQ